MKTTAVLAVLNVAILAASTARAADGAEELIGGAIRYGLGGAALASATASSLYFVITDLRLAREEQRPTVQRAAVELALSELNFGIGVGLLSFGVSQHDRVFLGLGASTMALSLPFAVHGIWGLAAGEVGDTPAARASLRRRAGIIELAFAVPQLLGGAGAFIALAYNPVDSVRRTGFTTTGVLLAAPLALTVHGIYLLATPPAERQRRAHAPRFVVAPAVLPDGGGMGVTAAGRF